MARNFAELEWLCPISKVAEHLTHNPKADGSKPTTGIGKEKMARNVIELEWLCPAGTMV
jgi:hypothetical protein